MMHESHTEESMDMFVEQVGLYNMGIDCWMKARETKTFITEH